MTNSLILTTSGFILPQNRLYEVLTKEKISNTSIFNRTVLVTTNSTVADLVNTGQIYHSQEANEAFLKYEDSGKFEDFMRMVDIAAEILGTVDFNKFFELQANNRHLTHYSFKMCVDLLNCEFVNTYRQYSVIPANTRFAADNGFSASQFTANVKILHKSKKYGSSTWENLLSSLANERAVFSTFFKYIFTDNY